MEFYENGGGAVATLAWSADGVSKQLIPESQLYPAGAPRIAVQPVSQTISAGNSVSLSVLASGTGPLSYVWSRNNTPIANSNSPTLNLTGVGAAHIGNYTVVATNTAGSATSNIATLTVTNLDTDGDGMPDEWETANGLNPNVADADLDSDKDGQTNRTEFLAGTSPKDPLSVFKAEVLRDGTGNPIIRFPAMAGKAYTVQWRTSPTTGTWAKLADIPAGATRTVDTADPTTAGVHWRVYRVVTPQQP
jgi:hypothetical protein